MLNECGGEKNTFSWKKIGEAKGLKYQKGWISNYVVKKNVGGYFK